MYLYLFSVDDRNSPTVRIRSNSNFARHIRMIFADVQVAGKTQRLSIQHSEHLQRHNSFKVRHHTKGDKQYLSPFCDLLSQ